MRNRSFTIFIVFILISSSNFPWGDEGHKLIARKCFSALPSKMKFMKSLKDEIVQYSIDPDTRKKDDRSEGPKHFMDIDFYKEFQQGRMIQSKDELLKIYGKRKVEDAGLLPWAILTTMKNLEDSFKQKDKEKIILFASDLAHYVADAYQPLHATTNYDGKLTGQKGIHTRYEIKMVDANLDEIAINIKPAKAELIKNPSDVIFNFISASNIYCELILGADKYSVEASAGDYDDQYYDLLWFRTKNLTERQMEDAASMIASFIYTAWINAGKPAII